MLAEGLTHPAATRSGHHRQRARGIAAGDETQRVSNFWQGRWAPLFAVGEGVRMCTRLEGTTSEALQSWQMSAEIPDFTVVMNFDAGLKRRLSATIAAKLAYHQRLPQRLAGVFAQFMGCSEAASKQCLADCMEEFDNIVNDNFKHVSSLRVFQRGTSLRTQAESYIQTPLGQDSLFDYPPLFHEVRAAAAGKLDETPAEQLHSLLHLAHLAPSYHISPALVCAMVRHGTVQTLAKNSPAFRQHLAQEWRRKGTFYKDLLEPLRGAKPIPRSYSWRWGYIFGYNIDELHPDIEEEQRVQSRWTSIVKSHGSVQPTPVSPAASAVVDWFRARFTGGNRIFSIPAAVFDIGIGGPPDEVPEPSVHELVAWVAAPPAAAFPDVGAFTFFEVVNATPPAPCGCAASTRGRTKALRGCGEGAG